MCCLWTQLQQVMQLAKPMQLKEHAKPSSLPLASSALLQFLKHMTTILAPIIYISTQIYHTKVLASWNQNQLLEVSQSWIAVLRANRFLDSHFSAYLTFGKAIWNVIWVARPQLCASLETIASRVTITYFSKISRKPVKICSYFSKISWTKHTKLQELLWLKFNAIINQRFSFGWWKIIFNNNNIHNSINYFFLNND